MKPKKVEESSIITSFVMMPEDANPSGNVHGGVIMKNIDTTAGVVAFRHTRCNSVTASIDSLVFHYPVFVGDLLTLKASLNMAGRTSMEIGVRVESENLLTGETQHTASAYLTFVSLGKDGRPIRIPGVILESEAERKRNREAVRRKEIRLAARNNPVD